MPTIIKLPLAALVLWGVFSLQACCGFDCNSDDDPDRVLLDLSLSDALPEDLQEVVIEIERVTLRRSGGDDVVIDTFSASDPEDPPLESVRVDLLDYPGANQFPLLRGFELDAASYNGIDLAIISGNINNSYVLQNDGQQRVLNVTNSELNLPGFRLTEAEESYTIEFDLARSLSFEGDSGGYRLGEVGISVVNDRIAATLFGNVQEALFDEGAPCNAKDNEFEGNRVYLYEGTGLDANNLADVFNSNSSTEVPENAIAPISVGILTFNSSTATWSYSFGFVAAGQYTLAFACDTEDDDSIDYDGLVIPAPEGQVYEVTLANDDRTQCDFRSDRRGC